MKECNNASCRNVHIELLIMKTNVYKFVIRCELGYSSKKQLNTFQPVFLQSWPSESIATVYMTWKTNQIVYIWRNIKKNKSLHHSQYLSRYYIRHRILCFVSFYHTIKVLNTCTLFLIISNAYWTHVHA